MIELDRVSKTYGAVAAVQNLTLDVASGELLVLLGGSGCGKTTTLKVINRLIEPTSGTVRIAGTDTKSLAGHELRRRTGYCFQEVGLFPHMTVKENVAVTLDLLGWSTSRQEARVEELLAMLGLEPRLSSLRASPTSSPEGNASAWESREHWLPNPRSCC